jgi:hypothetical protein
MSLENDAELLFNNFHYDEKQTRDTYTARCARPT